MRKTTTLKTLAAAALTILAAGCAKEQLAENGVQSGVSFTVEVPGAPATKAIGDGTTATRLYYQVFDNNGEPISELGAQFTDFDGKTAKVNFQLVKDQTYSFIFWAQTPTAGYYTIADVEGQENEKDLRTITANYTKEDGTPAHAANDENFDAFFAVIKGKKITGPVSETVTLTRPFAQINIASNDQISAGGTTQQIDFDHAESSFEVKDIPTVFSPLADTQLSGYKSEYITFTKAAAPCATADDKLLDVNGIKYNYLAMNYVFAPEKEGIICDIKATLTVDGKEVSLEVPNAPIKRNWRTNIVGKVLTTSTDINVVVDPTFDGNETETKVTDAQSLLAALPNTDKIILDNDITFSGEQKFVIKDGKELTLDLNGHNIYAPGSVIEIYNAKVDIVGAGEISETEDDQLGAIILRGSNDNVSDYTVVNIGKDVTLRGWSGIFVAKDSKSEYNNYGLVVNCQANIMLTAGFEKDAYGIYINGQNNAVDGNIATFNLENCNMNVKGSGIYAAGYAKWNLTNCNITAVNSAMEIRAGEMNITGGHYEATETQLTVKKNGNGTTIAGAALGISQHGTNLPINVTVNAGTFKSVYSLYEEDVQDSEARDQIKVAVKGGTFDGPIYSQNNTKFITGGQFTEAPAEEYIADGYAATKVSSNPDIYAVAEKGATPVINQEALNEAISGTGTSKDTPITVAPPAGETVTLDNGIANEGDKSRDITFVGNGTQTFDVVTNAVTAEGGELNYQRGSSFTFKNMTIQAGEGNFDGVVCDELTYENCTIKGKLTLYGKATFVNCVFDNTMADQYSIWTWGGTDVKFEGCEFNTNGKAILLYGQATAENPTNLTVTNCTFTDRNNGTAGKAAIEIGNDYNATYALNISGCTVNGFAEGKNTGSKVWANKNSMDKDHLSVTIDGNKVL